MPDKPKNKFSAINLPEIPESLNTAVENLTNYPTQNMGKTLGDIWFLVFGGITQAANKRKLKYEADLQKYSAELAASIDSIPEDKLIEPSIQTSAQALENSKYCITSDILRSMFVKLISGTMHKDLEPHIHPSFPEILKQLSEYDAEILKLLKIQNQIPIAMLSLKNKTGTFSPLVVDFCIIDSEKFTSYDTSISIASLRRAGLIETSYTKHLIDQDSYRSFFQSQLYSQTEFMCKAMGGSIYLQKGVCSLTYLGNEFISACV